MLDVDVHVQNSGEERLDALLGIEFAVMLLGGGHNPSARYEVGADERFAHDERRDLPAVTTLSAANDQLGVAIVAHLDRPADAWIAPIETVSNSEAGFELVYQGSAVLFVQPIGLDPGESTSFSVGHGVIVGTTGPVAAAPRT